MSHPNRQTLAAVITTGDELALGQALNTNSMWIADRLWAAGVEVIEHITLGDDRVGLAATILRLAEHVGTVVVTGGLGPTPDDVTRDALADALREDLVTDLRALEQLEARFRARRRELPEIQRRQATRPRSAQCLDNEHGTAPALYARLPGLAPDSGADIFCVPGPPGEMKPIVERDVIPRIRLPAGWNVRARFLHAVGIGEGDAAARLGDLLARGTNPLVGITVSGSVLTIRCRYAGTDEPAAAQAALDTIESRIRATLAPHVFGSGESTLESAVVHALAARRECLVVAESCTGGMLGSLITRVPGSSSVFVGGWITYSNELKIAHLGVPAELVATHGAVSSQVARAMAQGGLRSLHAAGLPTGARVGHCLAITGVAGPNGGTDAKPVGTVFIAHACGAAGESAETNVRKFRFSGAREDIRLRSAQTALAMLLTHQPGNPAASPRLLWEVTDRPNRA
ncbi:MAG: CinA family nicotinamide mononucleotide deamidase-related protein [Phycisphaeraceae bacterium]|nr:CinA family nicotinamide mononucleotide deamidase-related protein [Phycisphaeraceae bacterium]